MPARARRNATRSVQARMTDDDFEAIDWRSSRLEISTSEALRQLVLLAKPIERAEADGLVVHPSVIDADGWGGIAWGWGLTYSQASAVPGISEEQRNVLRNGGVLLAATELVAQLQAAEG